MSSLVDFENFCSNMLYKYHVIFFQNQIQLCSYTFCLVELQAQVVKSDIQSQNET